MSIFGSNKPGSGSSVQATVVSSVDSALNQLLKTPTVMTKGVFDLVQDAINAGSPWASAVAVSPDPMITDISDRLDEYLTKLDDMPTADPSTTHFEAFAEVAKDVADTVIGPSFATDAMTAFEEDTLPDYANAINNLAGGLYQSNAAEGSALFVGLALLSRGYINAKARYRASLEDRRATFLMQAVTQMQTEYAAQVDAQRLAFESQLKKSALELTARREEVDDNLEFAYKDAIWELNLLAFVQSSIASAGGAPTVPLGPSKLSMALSGALSGASAGATALAGLGPGGAALGAIGGGIFGYLAGANY